MKKLNKSEVFKLAHKLYNEALTRFNIKPYHRSLLWSKSLKMAYRLVKEGKQFLIKTFKVVLCLVKDLIMLPFDLYAIVNPRR